MNLKIDHRQVRALQALITIAQKDESIDSALRYEVSTILPMLSREQSSNMPEKAEFQARFAPYILNLDGTSTGMDTRITPQVINYMFNL